MEELFDSLSEDWISQPRSPHSSSLIKSLSPRSDRQVSQSKLPRYMSGTASRSSSFNAPLRRNSSKTADRAEALQARSPSELNASQNGCLDSGSRTKGQGTSQRSRHESSKLGSSTIQDTVQRVVSPDKPRYSNDTPEWKKRILKGGSGGGAHVDLLGGNVQPKVLAGVFKPPTIANKSPQKAIPKRKVAQRDGGLKNIHPNVATQSTRTMERVHNAVPALPNQKENVKIQARDVRKGQGEEPEHTKPNVSLNQDESSLDTDAFVSHGGYVTIERGGYSGNESFQQSLLVPSSDTELDQPSLPRVSAAAKMLSQTNSPHLETPTKTLRSAQSSPLRPKSAGSPLKLFDKYDTYTNDRLLRRMSKFEETFAADIDEAPANSSHNGPPSPSPGPKKTREFRATQQSGRNPGSRVGSFGQGELDEHEFIHSDEIDIASPVFDQNVTGEPRISSSRRSSTLQKAISDLPGGNERHKKSYIADQNSISTQQPIEQDLQHNDAHDHETTNGKRSLYPSSKARASKRRRTITDTDEEAWLQSRDLKSGMTAKDPLLELSGARKRKDALYHDKHEAANPSILAARQMRRPRQMLDGSPSISDHEFMRDTHLARGAEGHRSRNIADPPTQVVAGALASIAMHTAHDLTHGSRKTSVKTADYLNEAQRIMQYIRAEVRPQSSHTTADPSDEEFDIASERSVGPPESTIDGFSRPPSRDGDKRQILHVPRQVDPRVVSQLRKFEDADDLGLALTSSMQSLKIQQAKEQSAMSQSQADTEDGAQYDNDPPNIRILERRPETSQRQTSSIQHSQSKDSKNAGPQSQDSTGQSSKRSVPTASSGSASNRIVIAPAMVADLLTDQMAGMVFDREKGMWIKRKGSVNTSNLEIAAEVPCEDSELDLFEDIPDLSVDEMEELQRVREVVSRDAVTTTTQPSRPAQEQAHHDPDDLTEPTREERPRTAEGRTIAPLEDSSAPSKYSHFASSVIAPSTRATSWGDEVWPDKARDGVGALTMPVLEEQTSQTDMEEAEHEISIFEGRVSPTPLPQKLPDRRARVVTVAFSSPLIHAADESLLNHDQDVSSQTFLYEKDGSHLQTRGAQTQARRSSNSAHRSLFPKHSRRTSAERRSRLGRPMSRVDEHEEMSLVQCSVKRNGKGAMDIAITTPMPRMQNLLAPPTTEQSSRGAFELSPLSEFSMHQIDRPLDGSCNLITRRGTATTFLESNRQLSLTGQIMIKHLTDLEPYEPYWEHMKSASLRNQGLHSTHLLDEYCGGLEELDISDNRIIDVTGIPVGVRQLNVSGNCLSDLCSWNRLIHLQYLDISSNGLTSLHGLRDLIHLRELKADNNRIESLDGLERLDALLSLRARNNSLSFVDFESCALKRLAHLDLRGNAVYEVVNLHKLAVLQCLDLSHNDLIDLHIEQPMLALKKMNLAHNDLISLDVNNAPGVQTLILDANGISEVVGLANHKNIQSISWREQHCTDINHFASCHELQHLYLSNNGLNGFSASIPMLNMKTLELSSAGLQALPADLGLKCPNLRIINLNGNALKDLRPLLGIRNVRQLHLAGNRLARMRRTISVLEHIGNELCELDLRNNLLTVGFYASAEGSETGMKEQQMVGKDNGAVFGYDMDDFLVQSSKAFKLPALNHAKDEAYRDRLDEDTKLRRRVYEIMITQACKSLVRLDGLSVDGSQALERDRVWDRLVQLGVLQVK